jgi:hypothetical protein
MGRAGRAEANRAAAVSPAGGRAPFCAKPVSFGAPSASFGGTAASFGGMPLSFGGMPVPSGAARVSFQAARWPSRSDASVVPGGAGGVRRGGSVVPGGPGGVRRRVSGVSGVANVVPGATSSPFRPEGLSSGLEQRSSGLHVLLPEQCRCRPEPHWCRQEHDDGCPRAAHAGSGAAWGPSGAALAGNARNLVSARAGDVCFATPMPWRAAGRAGD